MARIWIGTSGWTYPHWRGRFYPQSLSRDEWLPFYAKQFSTVEINSTFYRLPSSETVAAWRAATPARFLFAAKLSRFITHMKKLKDPRQTLPPLLEKVDELDRKAGPLLIQLPPNWRRNTERLANFLAATPRTRRFAIELRNDSWWRDDTYDVLRANDVACCLFHLSGVWSPKVETANFVYFRLHGPRGAYSGSYSAASLGRIADWCRDWRDRNLDVFGYFDNDESAYAVRNALAFIELIESRN